MTRLLPAGAACLVALLLACGDAPDEGTRSVVAPTPTPSTRTPTPTPTPTSSEVARQRATELFTRQLEMIKVGDWTAVYDTCSPEFRESNARERFAENASDRFRLAGFTPDGFEARNIKAEVVRPGWVAVEYEAFQDGSAVRAVNSGGLYKISSGQWFDDRMWCR